MRAACAVAGRLIEAVVDVIVHQRLLGAGDGTLDGLQLLRDLEASTLFLEHADDAAQVALRPFQALDDFRMRSVSVHRSILTSWTG